MRTNATWMLAAILILASCENRSSGFDLVYFDEDGGNGQPRGLYNFDPLAGTSTLRATVPGTQRLFALDVRPSDGKVFATDLDSRLLTIDIDTGQLTDIGATGVSQMVGIAFSPIDGTLYGLQHNGLLYRVDPHTAACTFIGLTGGVERGLAFSPAGQLYGFTDEGHLYQIDPATAAVTPVGGRGNACAAMAEDAAFLPNGRLFATDFVGNLFETNPTTGDGTLIGTTGMGAGLLGLIVTPEPTTLSLLTIVGLGLFRRRRK